MLPTYYRHRVPATAAESADDSRRQQAGPCPVPSLFLHHRRVAASQCCRCAASCPPPCCCSGRAAARRWLAILLTAPARLTLRLQQSKYASRRGLLDARGPSQRGQQRPRPPVVWLARRTGQAGDPHARLADLRRLSGARLARQETGHLCASLLHWAPTRHPQARCHAAANYCCCCCCLCCCCAIARCLAASRRTPECLTADFVLAHAHYNLHHIQARLASPELSRPCPPVPGGSWRELNRPAAANYEISAARCCGSSTLLTSAVEFAYKALPSPTKIRLPS